MAEPNDVIAAKEYFTALMADLQGQLDRRIETQLRERAESIESMRNDIAAVDRVHTQATEALDVRVKTILDEWRQATRTAEEEREKSANALREGLTRQIEEGDANLDRHVAAQVESIRAALIAQEKLATEKDKQLEIVQKAAQLAVDKAEEGLNRRLDLLNEFREQIAEDAKRFATRDLVDSQFATATKALELINARVNDNELDARESFVRKEVFERFLADQTTWRQGIDKRQAEALGRESAVAGQADKSQGWKLAVFGLAGTLLISVVIVVANVLTTQ